MTRDPVYILERRTRPVNRGGVWVPGELVDANKFRESEIPDKFPKWKQQVLRNAIYIIKRGSPRVDVSRGVFKTQEFLYPAVIAADGTPLTREENERNA